MPNGAGAPGISAIYHPDFIDEQEHDKDNAPVITSIAGVLEWEQELRIEFFDPKKKKTRTSRRLPVEKTHAGDRLQEIWFRGTRKHFLLEPGIYHQPITDLANDPARNWLFRNRTDLKPANKQELVAKQELRRLNLERNMMLTFERESGPLLQYKFEQELYFLARHYGMPSRLLDWSISPLVALFMCVFPEPRQRVRGMSKKEQLRGLCRELATPEEDGVLYAMDPEGLDPPGYIHHQHHPDVLKAVEVITKWGKPGKRLILPISPHRQSGRIDRQLSRFTLHAYGSKSRENKKLRSRRILAASKEQIRGQLERMGVNEFTVYDTLDRLVSDIRDRFSNFKLHST